MEMKPEWELFGSGASQMAFKNPTETKVFRFYTNSAGGNSPYPFEDVQRTVEKWNKINSKLTPLAYVSKQFIPALLAQGEDPSLANVSGYITPFVHGRPATDKERCVLVRYLFNFFECIFIDATNEGNCITQENGETVCIDVDLLLKLDQAESDFLYSRKRGSSFTSLETWNTLGTELIRDNLYGAKADAFPLTAQTIKALLFIQAVRPDIGNADFLSDDINLDLMANAYEQRKSPQPETDVLNLAHDFLEQERPAQLSSLKITCDDLLNKYLSSCSSPNATALIEPQHLMCQQLMHHIQDAGAAEEIVQYIEALREQVIPQENYKDFRRVLAKCLLASDALYAANNRKSLVYIAQFFAKYIYNRPNVSSTILVHTLDLANINARILLPLFFLNMFDQEPNVTEFFFLVMIVLSLPLLTEFKHKLLVDISEKTIQAFTIHLLDLDLSVYGIQGMQQALTPEYKTQLSTLIKGTYGELLPAYAALAGFGIATAYQDKVVGGFAIAAFLLYFSYTCYFLNPKYAKSFRANLAENQILYAKLSNAIIKKDFIKYFDQEKNTKHEILRIMQNSTPGTKKKNNYDAQTKIFGILTGNIIFLISSLYVINTYQQSDKSIVDYILLYYYLSAFLGTIHQISSLMSQVLSAAGYTKPLAQYSMWATSAAQQTYRERYQERPSMLPQKRQDDWNNSMLWQLQAITFHDVFYRHHLHVNQKLIKINLKIEAEQCVALVGEKQGEQNIFARLLRREATPLSGRILFNQIDNKALQDRTLYDLLCIIDSKDEFIGKLSWYETIQYGNPTASEEKILEAAHAAGIIAIGENVDYLKTQFVSHEMLPIEKRRLAIARAILKGGLCLMLDNPTAGLTYNDEISILNTLIPLTENIMTVMITDRLYLLDRYINTVYYIKNGTIQEMGDYGTLINKKADFCTELAQQKAGLQELLSPQEKIFTIMSSQLSMIKQNFKSNVYTLSANIRASHEEEQNEGTTLLHHVQL